MDFTKFASLLDRRALFFPSVEHLSKDDPLEGSLARGNVELYRIDPRTVPLEVIKMFRCEDRDQFSRVISVLPSLGRHQRDIRKSVFVNCWHMNEGESAAMWAIYTGNAPGIAITSTYERMRTSFTCVKEDIYIGTVTYEDYALGFIPQGTVLAPIMYKRRSFEYENELRALIMMWPKPESETKEGITHTSDGLYVSCLLEDLVDEVYVSPKSAKWYRDLVESFIKKYGFKFSVRQSNMKSEPLF